MPVGMALGGDGGDFVIEEELGVHGLGIGVREVNAAKEESPAQGKYAVKI